MGRILVVEDVRQIGIEEFEEPPLGDNEVRIETLYSGISAGTQLTLYRGQSPFLDRYFDNDLRLCLDRDRGSSLYPTRGCWAYEEVGRVVELGPAVSKVELGSIVYGSWGHKTSTVLSEDTAADHVLPQGMDPLNGIYSLMGAVAMNAILDADIHVGETIAVFGQGVPGQIISQLARLNGATVIAVDMEENRLAMSKKLGAAYTFNPRNCDVGLEIKRLTGRGADKSIEVSGFGNALHEAIRSTVYNGKVVCAGFIVGTLDGLRLGEEFHHNRINIISSQIQNVNPGVSNAWNLLRMKQNIMALAYADKLDLKSLITHVLPFDQGAEAYHLLDTSRDCMQVVLSF